MSQALSTATIITVLKGTFDAWRRHSDELRQLDAVIGDGDLGVTVELSGMATADYLANPGEEDIGKLLMKCGMQINKSTPSTFGTLLASAFMEAGKAVLGCKEIQLRDLLLVGQRAIDGIKKRGKAEVGDKTMLDALVPAVEVFRQALAKGTEQKAALKPPSRRPGPVWRQPSRCGPSTAGAAIGRTVASGYRMPALLRCTTS